MHKRQLGVAGTLGGLAASLVLVLGCGDELPKPTADDFAAAQEQAIQNVKRAKASRKKRDELKREQEKAKPGQQTEVATTVASGVLLETGYTYDPAGKRDPFRNFTWDRPDRFAQREDAGPLEQFDLTQLEVVAVVWRTGNARALVEAPSGENYIVGEGAAIGKNQGRIIAIDDNTVVVKEIYVDYLGQETTKDIEMRIRSSEGG